MNETQDTYFATEAGLPPQSAILTGRVVVTPLYALIPENVIADNVCSVLPGWTNTRAWILAAPSIGLGASFAEYLMFIQEGGGCESPEQEPGIESFLFVLRGRMELAIEDQSHLLADGGYAFIPDGTRWSLRNPESAELKYLWLRKPYKQLGSLRPQTIVGDERGVPVKYNPTTNKKWTTQLIPTDDIAYDMHMNIVSFEPGTVISIVETHIMEHGLYMLQGKGIYLLNTDWREVKEGDFIWMRSFCPQAYCAGGLVRSRYLLYKDVNRQVTFD